MKKPLCLAISVISALSLASCGEVLKPKTVEPATTYKPAVTEPETGTVPDFDKDKYLEDLLKEVESQERSDAPLTFTPHGELVVPDKDAEEADLGSYYVSADGVKLYYEKDEYPMELMLTLEKYFSSYADGDYTLYTRCVLPSYLDEMDKYLQKDYGYGMKKSFSTQCANLASNTYGKFKVTRIKLEKPEESDDTVIEKFFSEHLNDIFGKNYYEQVKSECDKIHFAEFFVMAEGSTGGETNLVSEFSIIFAEKDGRFYALG